MDAISVASNDSNQTYDVLDVSEQAQRLAEVEVTNTTYDMLAPMRMEASSTSSSSVWSTKYQESL
jgi:hypothetical protein